VVVAYQNRIEMAETLRGALAKIFGPTITASLAADRLSNNATSVIETPSDQTGVIPTAVEAGDGSASALVSEMSAHWDAADKALRAGDIAGYGTEMKKAREAFDRLQKIIKK